VATEAAILVAQFGFQELGLRRVEIVTGVENSASRRVAEKASAHFEGILRRRIKLGDRNIDAAMYSLIPEDLWEVPTEARGCLSWRQDREVVGLKGPSPAAFFQL
jgi:hypothetical protein